MWIVKESGTSFGAGLSIVCSMGADLVESRHPLAEIATAQSVKLGLGNDGLRNSHMSLVVHSIKRVMNG